MDNFRHAPYLLIYDGACAFCCALVRGVRRWDRAERIQAFPLQDDGARMRAGVTRASAERELQLVRPDGRRYEGADAVSHALELLPGGRLAGRLLRLAPLAPLARRAYRYVAAHRSALSRHLPGTPRPSGPCG